MKLDVLIRAYRKYRYRNWIKSTLAQKNGRAHLQRLEDDIGVDRGYFANEAKGSFLTDIVDSVSVRRQRRQIRHSSAQSDKHC